MDKDSFLMIQITKEVVVSHLNAKAVSDDALPNLIRGVYKAFLDVQQMRQAHLNAAAHCNKNDAGLGLRAIPQKRTTLKEILDNAAAPSSTCRRPALEDEAAGTSVDTPNAKATELPQRSAQEPAVPIEASVHPDYIICLEDGRKFTMMKRWLASKYGMTPEQYRAKWGLPDDYPLTAPNYSKVWSLMAKQAGLGGTRKR